jgi:hypothetical protein
MASQRQWAEIEAHLVDSTSQIGVEINEFLDRIHLDIAKLGLSNPGWPVLAGGLLTVGLAFALPLAVGGVATLVGLEGLGLALPITVEVLGKLGLGMAGASGIAGIGTGIAMGVANLFGAVDENARKAVDLGLGLAGGPFAATFGTIGVVATGGSVAGLEEGIWWGKAGDLLWQVGVTTNSLLSISEGSSPFFPALSTDRARKLDEVLQTELQLVGLGPAQRTRPATPPHDMNTLERGLFGAPQHPIYGDPQAQPVQPIVPPSPGTPAPQPPLPIPSPTLPPPTPPPPMPSPTLPPPTPPPPQPISPPTQPSPPPLGRPNPFGPNLPISLGGAAKDQDEPDQTPPPDEPEPNDGLPLKPLP